MAGLLRLLTCGSVDDGKSTLIGRLLVETGSVSDDQMEALRRDGGTAPGEPPNYALLLDGLEAEREQGITIDVAWRYFATPARAFIVADCPGHARYTRNMVTGASTAELALLLVDATIGPTTQTLRHAAIVALLGIRRIVLVVNKIDLVGYEAARFAAIAAEFAERAGPLGGAELAALPVSARLGDNVTAASPRLGWHQGPSLLALLERVPPTAAATAPLRLPVQWVNRPDTSFRGYAGTLATGSARPGERVTNARTGETAAIARIVAAGGDRAKALAGDAVTLVLDAAIDVARGDVLAGDPPPLVADQFAAHMIWLADAPAFAGRSYLFKLATCTTGGSITDIRHTIDPETRTELPARMLAANDIGVVHVAFDRPVAHAAYREDRCLGGFIVIDRLSDETVGAGMIDFALWRGTNLHRQALGIDRAARAAALRQNPAAVWFTGLSGAGKSTIADLVEQRLHALGAHTYLLDGDNVRHGLNRDLGFTEADRVENIRRAAEVGRLFVDAGLIVLISFIAPYASDREAARARYAPGEFVEVFVDTPLAVCEGRDPKGLYARARRGEIRHFTGVDAPYERPATPDIHLRGETADAASLADQVVAWLRARGMVA